MSSCQVRSLKPLKILIVSGNALLRHALGGSLGCADVTHAVVADDARKLIMAAVLDGHPFDLVILDGVTPEEVAAEWDRETAPPVVELQRKVTRYLLCSHDGVTPRALLCQVNHCFLKSAAPLEVVSYVKRLLTWEGRATDVQPIGRPDLNRHRSYQVSGVGV